MKIYGDSIKLTFILSIVSFIVSYIIKDYNLIFYSDILIGIFSGAFLTLLTSIIGYKVERRQALETFSIYCKKYANSINHFEMGYNIENKIDRYLDYLNKDLPDFGDAYNKIHFLFDFKKKNKLYIYNQIYLPIQNLNNKFRDYHEEFEIYKNSSDKNQSIMAKYCTEIDVLVFNEIKCTKNGEILPVTIKVNALFRKIIRELNNRYYIIMYGKRVYKKALKSDLSKN